MNHCPTCGRKFKPKKDAASVSQARRYLQEQQP